MLEITKRGHVATILLDRPPVNALNLELYEALADAFSDALSAPDVRSVVLGSKARTFCAGADLRETDPGVTALRSVRARELFEAVRHHPVPVIAAIHGPALGAGAVLAGCCDVRYASEEATFGLPEINVGLLGGARHLMRLIPQGVLREVYFTGGAVEADAAFRLGLVQRITPTGEVLEAAQELAAEIAQKSPAATRLAKAALNSIEGLGIEDGYRLEQTLTHLIRDSPEAVEARTALAENRPPDWRIA
jgi:enoyl-CoA hydratase/carnithine racemase